MTKLLEKALEEVAKLPASEQDAVAALLLEELASEQRWCASFGKSQDKLAKLAEEALAECNAGRTKPPWRSCNLTPPRRFAHASQRHLPRSKQRIGPQISPGWEAQLESAA